LRAARNFTSYPTDDKVEASALPRLPAPTMLMVGGAADCVCLGTAGRIADRRIQLLHLAGYPPDSGMTGQQIDGCAWVVAAATLYY